MTNGTEKLRADLAEISGEDVVRAFACAAVKNTDRQVWELQTGIEPGNRRIIPLLDFPQIDIRQDFSGEPQFARSLREVVNHDNSDQDGGQLENVEVGAFLSNRKWSFAAAKVSAAFQYVLSTLGSSDGQVADLNGGILFVIFVSPSAIERFRHARAGNDQESLGLREGFARLKSEESQNHEEGAPGEGMHSSSVEDLLRYRRVA